MTVRISSIRTATAALPLPEPLALGAMTVTRREYVAVSVSDDDGHTGMAYALTREAPMAEIVERLLAPHLVGREFETVEDAWHAALRGSAIVGRVGLVRRALGLVDNALWDLQGKRSNTPVWKLLGTGDDARETMLVAAYPTPGRSLQSLVDEVVSQADEGWPLVKISRSPDRDLMATLMKALRAELPARTRLVVDVGFGWKNAEEAIDDIRAWGETELAWLEDPFLPEDIDATATLSRVSGQRIGVGDEVTDPDVLKALIERGGVDVMRVDPVAIGGVTAAQEVITWAAERHVPVSCHISPEVSAHLRAGVETFGRGPNGNPYDPSPLLVQGGPRFEGGRARPNSEPGFGFDFVPGIFAFGGIQ